MKPSRYQPLAGIYQSFKTLLYDTVLCQYTTDFTLPVACFTIQKTEEILLLLENQMALEEAVLFSAIHDYEPTVVAILRDDHRVWMTQIRQLRNQLVSLQQPAETYQVILNSSRLLRQFNEFMVCCFEQMRSHEALVHPVLWRYYSDEELKQVALSLCVIKKDIVTEDFEKARFVISDVSYSNQ